MQDKTLTTFSSSIIPLNPHYNLSTLSISNPIFSTSTNYHNKYPYKSIISQILRIKIIILSLISKKLFFQIRNSRYLSSYWDLEMIRLGIMMRVYLLLWIIHYYFSCWVLIILIRVLSFNILRIYLMFLLIILKNW